MTTMSCGCLYTSINLKKDGCQNLNVSSNDEETYSPRSKYSLSTVMFVDQYMMTMTETKIKTMKRNHSRFDQICVAKYAVFCATNRPGAIFD